MYNRASIEKCLFQQTKGNNECQDQLLTITLAKIDNICLHRIEYGRW